MKKAFGLLFIALLLPCVSCTPQADGAYWVAATLSGGSGRASVESPAKLTVAGEAMEATIVFSSASYTWVEMDGKTYEPVNAEGNSTFVLPVRLDEPLPLTAETVAMSAPHTVSYSLYLDAASLQPAKGEAVKSALPMLIGGAVLVGGWVLLFCLYGKRKAA